MLMCRLLLYPLLLVGSLGCEIAITAPTPATQSPPAGPSISIVNTNTNTSTNDQSDTAPSPSPTQPGPGGGTTVIPLPAYGEAVTRAVAAANPTLLRDSCEATHGPSAWQFLDLVIRTLREHAQDPRWGYLCKDANCIKVGADIVAYKAGQTDTGIWLVDIIGNHCPGPADVVEVRWGVLPFEVARRWTGTRIP